MSVRQWLADAAAIVLISCWICFANNAVQAQVHIRELDKPKPPAIVAKPKPKMVTDTAKKATMALDREIELGDVDVTVGELDQFLEDQLDSVGVFIDQRGLQVASVDANQQVQASVSTMPLRAALRKMLRPLALKVVVEDEGLVITADYGELVRRGIATDRCTQGGNEADDAILGKMSQSVSISANEEPLSDFLARLSKKVEIPILVDRRALEEIGLSADEPVSFQLEDVSLRSGLRLILRDLDLTYMIRDEVLQITTVEAAEQNLVNRIYFMEGFGDAGDAGNSMSKVIVASIIPDTWEQLGGPSVIIPMISDERPAIIVSTTSDVHDQIKSLLDSLRKAGSTAGPKVDVPRAGQLR